MNPVPAHPVRARRSRGTVAVLAVFFTCNAAYLLPHVATSTPAVAEDAPTTAVPVQTVTSERRDVPVYLDGLGTVQAENSVRISSQVAGQLQSVAFVEGQHVKMGDLIAVIDPRPFQAALDQATAKIAQDQANLLNARYLLRKDALLAPEKAIPQDTLEEQQAQVDGLVAQLAQDQAAKVAAEVALSYTRILSPIDGLTGIRKIDPGNQIAALGTTPIVTVTQTDPIAVIFTLQEGDLAELRASMTKGPVEVIATTIDKERELGSGTIRLIDNEIDQATGSLRIKSIFANPDQKLWPGQAVAVRVRERVLSQALTIPSPALQRGPDGFYVYIIDADGAARIKKVTPGPVADGHAVIATGLSGSETIVVTGQYRLSPGVKVSQTAFTPTAAKD